MIVKFKKLHIHNFLSFGNAEIDLDDSGYIFIRGINESDDNAKSNGSGKSSIWCAFSWVLTGSTIRGTKDVVNNKAADGAWVKIEFNIDDKFYSILRSKNSDEYGTNLKIYIDDKDVSGKGIRDTEKKLQQYLPDLTSDLIGSVIILGQGLPQRFTNNTPSGRKEVLEKLSKSDFMIDDLKKRVAESKSKKEAQLLKYAQEVAELTGQFTSNYQHIISLTNELEDLKHVDELKELVTKLKEAKSKVEAEIEESKNQLKSLNTQLDTLRERYRKLSNEESSKLLQLQQEYVESTQSILIERTKTDSLLSAKEDELHKAKNIKDICPTCGQHIDGVVKPDTSSIEAKILDLRQSLVESNKRLSEIETLLKSKKTEVVNDYKQSIEDIIKKAEKVKKCILKEECDEKESTEKLSDICDKLSTAQSKLMSCESLKETLIKKLKEAKALSEKLTEQTTSKHCSAGILQQSVDVLSKFETILKRDFRGILLSNVIAYLDNKIKEYAECVFGSRCVAIQLDGNAVNVLFNGRSYENLSGGERQKLDVMVQFAIRDMLCTHLNFSSNILVIDEVFDGLDSLGCQQIVDLIALKLQDIDSIFIISHHTDINIPYDKEITVIKNKEGVSHIR